MPEIVTYAIPISLGIIGVWLLAKLIGRLRPIKPKEEEPRKKTFLEEALEAEAERPKHSYSWREFQTDLHNATMSFEEIYEKYGGVFPQKPEDPPPPLAGPVKQAEELPKGSPAAFWIQGAEGQNGGEGSKGAEGPGGRCPDRMKELQDWFKKRGEDVPLKKLVPPPPAPHTVIHKIYTRR